MVSRGSYSRTDCRGNTATPPELRHILNIFWPGLRLPAGAKGTGPASGPARFRLRPGLARFRFRPGLAKPANQIV